jgi:transcription antitermination factor NusG
MSLEATGISSERTSVRIDGLQGQSMFFDSHWYAIYTWANHEKRVAREIAARGIEHYVPLYRSVRWWKDRRVELDLPLFPSYVFARLALCDKLKVLQVSSVVRFVGFNGQPAALPDDEFETLRAGLKERARVEPCPFLTVGRRVRIVGGPFTGLQGVLKRKKSSLRVVVSLDVIQRSLAVEVEAADVTAIH